MDRRLPLFESEPDYYRRALSLWPRLSQPRLSSTRRNPRQVAALVSRRTNMPIETILALLGAPPSPGDERPVAGSPILIEDGTRHGATAPFTNAAGDAIIRV